MATRKISTDRRFFTTSEVARYCEVSPDGVLKWIKSGKLRAFCTPGGHHRVSIEDFRDFLQRYEMPVLEDFFGDDDSRRVLIVDDEETIREIIRRRLSEADRSLVIEEATDGYDAGIKIGAALPDLIVLDVMMPRVDGLQLIRSIRSNPKTRSTRVIAITGAPDEDAASRMREAGADVCLRKPIDFDRFLAEVKDLLDDSRSERPAASRRAR